MCQTGRRHRDQIGSDRLGRLVRQAGEDHLVETLRLLLHRRHDTRMTMAVRDHPPRRYGIENTPPIRGLQPRPGCPLDDREIVDQRVLRERMPDRT